jgi:lysyl-tRNA synthetase class II
MFQTGLENRHYGRRDPPRCQRDTLYLQKLTLTLPTSGGCSLGVDRLRTEATEFSLDVPELWGE